MLWLRFFLEELLLAIVIGYVLMRLILLSPTADAMAHEYSLYRFSELLFGPRHLKKEDREVANDLWRSISVLAICIFAAADAIFFLWPSCIAFYLWLRGVVGVELTTLFGGFGLIVLGWAAFSFKKRDQQTYGALEVIFAGIAAVIAIRQITPGRDWSGQFASLVGAVYIVSRGLSNVEDGAKQIHNRMLVAAKEKAAADALAADVAKLFKPGEIKLPGYFYPPPRSSDKH